MWTVFPLLKIENILGMPTVLSFPEASDVRNANVEIMFGFCKQKNVWLFIVFLHHHMHPGLTSMQARGGTEKVLEKSQVGQPDRQVHPNSILSSIKALSTPGIPFPIMLKLSPFSYMSTYEYESITNLSQTFLLCMNVIL